MFKNYQLFSIGNLYLEWWSASLEKPIIKPGDEVKVICESKKYLKILFNGRKIIIPRTLTELFFSETKPETVT